VINVSIQAPQFSHKDIEIKGHKITYQGYFQMKCVHFRHRLFAGGWSPVIKREVLEANNAVGVLGYDPALNQVVLIQQFRIGAVKGKESPWLVEIIAGTIEKNNDDYEQTAHREAKEEAGLELLDLHPICQYWTCPGGISEEVHLFCAKVDASSVGGIHGLAEENEDIKVMAIDVCDAFAALANGHIKHAAAIIALQWLQLNLEQLKRRWL
jgi:ADP-ribose pyrophosphatase